MKTNIHNNDIGGRTPLVGAIMNKYIFIGFFLTCMFCSCSPKQNIPELKYHMFEFPKQKCVVFTYALDGRENSLIFILEGNPLEYEFPFEFDPDKNERFQAAKIITYKGAYNFEWRSSKPNVLICGKRVYRLTESRIISLKAVNCCFFRQTRVMRDYENIPFSKLNRIQIEKLLDVFYKESEQDK